MRGGSRQQHISKSSEENPDKRALNRNEPLPIGDLLDPPGWMSDSQKGGWNYAIENAPRGLLKKLDRSALVAWVIAEDLHRQASGMVEKYGLLTKTPGTGAPMQSPYLPVVNKQAQIMLRAAKQLGFSPVSRSRVQLAEELDLDRDDQWAQLG